MSNLDARPANYTGVIIGALLLPILIIFDFLGRLDVGLNVFICVAMSMLAARMRWDLRKNLWFWIVLAIMLTIQVPLIVTVQWPHRWVPKIVLLPIGLASLGISLGSVYLVERFVPGQRPDDEPSR